MSDQWGWDPQHGGPSRGGRNPDEPDAPFGQDASYGQDPGYRQPGQPDQQYPWQDYLAADQAYPPGGGQAEGQYSPQQPYATPPADYRQQPTDSDDRYPNYPDRPVDPGDNPRDGRPRHTRTSAGQPQGRAIWLVVGLVIALVIVVGFGAFLIVSNNSGDDSAAGGPAGSLTPTPTAGTGSASSVAGQPGATPNPTPNPTSNPTPIPSPNSAVNPGATLEPSAAPGPAPATQTAPATEPAATTQPPPAAAGPTPESATVSRTAPRDPAFTSWVPRNEIESAATAAVFLPVQVAFNTGDWESSGVKVSDSSDKTAADFAAYAAQNAGANTYTLTFTSSKTAAETENGLNVALGVISYAPAGSTLVAGSLTIGAVQSNLDGTWSAVALANTW